MCSRFLHLSSIIPAFLFPSFVLFFVCSIRPPFLLSVVRFILPSSYGNSFFRSFLPSFSCVDHSEDIISSSFPFLSITGLSGFPIRARENRSLAHCQSLFENCAYAFRFLPGPSVRNGVHYKLSKVLYSSVSGEVKEGAQRVSTSFLQVWPNVQ